MAKITISGGIDKICMYIPIMELGSNIWSEPSSNSDYSKTSVKPV